jgi:hypothetical protein
MMFPVKPCNVMEMRTMNIQLCNESDKDICHWVIIYMHVWLQEVVRKNGSHIEQVLLLGGGGGFSKFLKTKIYKLFNI